MKIIKKNNDITVDWTIERLGEPERLIGSALNIYLVNIYEDIRIDEYILQENTIRFIFEGRKQKLPGKYGLKLIVNQGEKGMFTLEECDVFCLTDSCICDSNEKTHIFLKSNIQLPSNGLSAYEIAVLHGFQGSESEWIEQFNAAIKSNTIRYIRTITQSEYCSLEVKDENTMYVITEE